MQSRLVARVGCYVQVPLSTRAGCEDLLEGPGRVRAPVHERGQVVARRLQSVSDARGGAVRPVDTAENQPVLGALQPVDLLGQTISGDLSLVCLTGAPGRRSEHLRPVWSCLGEPLGEQLVKGGQGGHMSPFQFDLAHSGVVHLRQQGAPLGSSHHYAVGIL